MSDERPVVLWRLVNGKWDQVGDPRPASHAGLMLSTALEANRRAAESGSGEFFSVLPEGEKP